MKRSLLILAALLLIPFSLKAQPVGMDMGLLFSMDGDSRNAELCYSVSTDTEIGRLSGSTIDILQLSVVYSDRDIPEVGQSTEVYALRSMLGKGLAFGKWYAAILAGSWTFINSEGSDMAQATFGLQGGRHAARWEFHGGADVISADGPNLVWVYAGVSFKL